MNRGTAPGACGPGPGTDLKSTEGYGQNVPTMVPVPTLEGPGV
jgi:hypothetical protein